jgi:glucose/arabinose dehydrogenase
VATSTRAIVSTATVAPTATSLPPATSLPTATPSASALKIELKPEVSGLRQPLFVTSPRDGSGDIYIVEKAGRIRVADGSTLRTDPFLDITARVRSSELERGLLGLAFHPKYQSNGYLYVNYTDLNGDTVISRFTASGDRRVADASSEKMILQIKQPYANHNGGNLVFGPDGMLWIGMGDGGSGGDPQRNGQNKNALLGKMLRIDVDRGDPYTIPPDNPFVNQPNARGEVWAYGLRNPWRWSFDRLNGDLYIGDVGQNAWEEIDYVPTGSRSGTNFGWNIMEGLHCYPENSTCDRTGITLPVYEYPTRMDGCAIVGGYVYRGKQFPAMNGKYFFSDNCNPTIWSLARGADGKWARTVAVAPADTSIGVSSFGEDEAGEIYVTGLSSGVIYRLVVR